jgi:predicted branched-subunit amino acid permease
VPALGARLRAYAEPRRQLILDSVGIAIAALAFGLVYGLAARTAGFSAIEASAMSVFVFGGAAQFAAVGYVASGLSWPVIAILTGFLNARHLLYSAALAPWLVDRPRRERAVMAHLLTDEAFALTISHFKRIGGRDAAAYWIPAIGATFVPWNLATIAGVLLGDVIPDPVGLGLDLVFPAAMAGLAIGLISGSRELIAAVLAVAFAVPVGLVAGPAVGIIVGGLLGPVGGLLAPVSESIHTGLSGPDEPDATSTPGADHRTKVATPAGEQAP